MNNTPIEKIDIPNFGVEIEIRGMRSIQMTSTDSYIQTIMIKLNELIDIVNVMREVPDDSGDVSMERIKEINKVLKGEFQKCSKDFQDRNAPTWKTVE